MGKVVCHLKTNISQKTPPYTFRIEPNSQNLDMARLVWGAETDLTADELVQSFGDRNGEKVSKLDIAKSFLQGALFKGPQLSAQLEEKATESDISLRTLDRAKESLGVKSAQVKNDDGLNVWVSYFPEHEGKIKNFWRPGVLPQNSDPEANIKLDKILELQEKIQDRLGVLGFGVLPQPETQDAKVPAIYQEIETMEGQKISIDVAQIIDCEAKQLQRALGGAKEFNEWECTTWLAWINEWGNASGLLN